MLLFVYIIIDVITITNGAYCFLMYKTYRVTLNGTYTHVFVLADFSVVTENITY